MKLLLGDDHLLFAEGTNAILSSFMPLVEIDVVHNGKDAYNKIVDQPYDAVLLDLRLPALSGFDLLRKLQEEHSLTPVIILTASDNPADAEQAIQLGARAFITKKCSGQEIVSTINRVLSGEIVVLADQEGAHALGGNTNWAKQHDITPRQLEVLRLVRLGLSNQSIADQLSISLATVKSHISALFTAFNAATRSEVVDRAQMHGLD